MRLRIALSVALLLASLASGAPKPTLPVLDLGLQVPRSRVLVLGTLHLRDAPEEFSQRSFLRLLDKLAAFRPDIIAIEHIPGESCDFAARHPLYDMGRFCADTAAAKAATGLDVPSALAERNKLLGELPAKATPQQRRHLAAVFMAANEAPSALVQWLQLPQAERHTGDGLDEALVAALSKAERARDESSQIAARLAARLGLARLVSIDDHTGDNLDVADVTAYSTALQEAWNSSAAELQPLDRRQGELMKAADSLPVFQYLNTPEVLRARARGDFGAALAHPSPQHFGQMYVAGWETRNLRMAANIRAAFRELPGARVLTIVGASHKLWLDGLLQQMQGVDVVDVEQVLK